MRQIIFIDAILHHQFAVVNAPWIFAMSIRRTTSFVSRYNFADIFGSFAFDTNSLLSVLPGRNDTRNHHPIGLVCQHHKIVAPLYRKYRVVVLGIQCYPMVPRISVLIVGSSAMLYPTRSARAVCE